MALKKKGGDNLAPDTTGSTEPTTPSRATARKPLTIAAIIGGGALALGAAFGVGFAAAHAAPGQHDGKAFASTGEMHREHGGRDGDRGGHRELGELQHSGEARPGQHGQHGQHGMVEGEADFCHPGDGHSHDANGNDVAPSDAAEGFTCQTGPLEGGSVTP
jgi:hypothetical protein